MAFPPPTHLVHIATTQRRLVRHLQNGFSRRGKLIAHSTHAKILPPSFLLISFAANEQRFVNYGKGKEEEEGEKWKIGLLRRLLPPPSVSLIRCPKLAISIRSLSYLCRSTKGPPLLSLSLSNIRRRRNPFLPLSPSLLLNVVTAAAEGGRGWREREREREASAASSNDDVRTAETERRRKRESVPACTSEGGRRSVGRSQRGREKERLPPPSTCSPPHPHPPPHQFVSRRRIERKDRTGEKGHLSVIEDRKE